MPGHPFWGLALLGALYFAGAKLGMLTVLPEGMAIFWPPNALVLAALIRFGRRRLFQIGAVVIAAEIAADVPTFSVGEALLFGLINFGEAALAWALLQRLRFDPRFPSLADAWKFFFAVPVGAALAGAALGAAVYTYFRGGETGYLEFMRSWWFGDGLGLMILTPLLLGFQPFAADPAREPLHLGWRDAAAALAAVVVAAAIWLKLLPVFLLILFILYAAARFSPRWVAVALTLLAAFLVLALTQGREPFGALPAREAVLMAQRFLFVSAVLGLGFSALLSQLRRQQAELETRVAERTRELREANEELARLVTVDPLTGVGNRRLFDDVLAREVARVQRYSGTLSLVFADIDRFKRINDQHGHAAGDEVIRNIAGTLQRCARETDLVVRYGGEEFGILLPGTPAQAAALFAERARRAVAGQPHRVSGEHVTVSFGVAELRPGMTQAGLVAEADAALYRAKDAGRDRVVLAAVGV
jgi:diguanylate cyclase (GGDEF)-like protein